ncbi:hypothetical protein [Stakelama tenebrarum]|uniref:Uncharacterized protein n=1 Tax=Stakelama tenebrarum TaxID=2711215 RepID=A0A6G6Y814_9SPHN|nr:hypothetical protein [Sphingosinithalassobacter tenebrarum]QIG81082.1 hypothetical protein G5C33_15685 [Sphingosinithalassobacter tenebrarum]
MNIHANFLGQHAETVGDGPAADTAIADLQSALEQAAHQTFMLSAEPECTIVRGGRVGVKFRVAKCGSSAATAPLVVWINGEGRTMSEVLEVAKYTDRRIPVRRSWAGFHTSFTNLEQAQGQPH